MTNSSTAEHRVKQASPAPLGKPAKSASLFSPAKARALRFKALSTARSWLIADAVESSPDNFPGDVHRTVDCRWTRTDPQVSVHRTIHQSAIFGGLATCGSVWSCPICCAVIQERRRLEIAHAMEWAYANGYTVSMVTFTFPHMRGDSLPDLISQQAMAFRGLRGGKAWQDFKGMFGFVGLIRSLELTHGQNGWHPHTHELWITRKLSEAEQVRFDMAIRSRWLKVCQKVGLCETDFDSVLAFNAHAVDVKFNCRTSDYLAKLDSSQHWGADREIAKATSKKGRIAGKHPFDFLQAESENRGLYLEFIKSMKGRRQLFWSHGLKDMVGIEDLTDKETTDRETDKAVLLGLITRDQWQVIRGNDARAEILHAAELVGWVGVVAVLRGIGAELTADQVALARAAESL